MAELSKPEHGRPMMDARQMEEYLILSSALAFSTAMLARLGKREKELKPASLRSSFFTDSYPGSEPDPVFGDEPNPHRSSDGHVSPESCIHEKVT
jgi:hypothetical protein